MLEIGLLLILILFLKAAQPGLWPTLLLVGIWGIIALPGAWMIFKMAPPLVPTPQKTVKKMIEFGKIGPGKLVYDLGCGEGRILREAARKGAKAIGYEISIPTFLLATFLCLRYRNIRVRFGNFWNKNVSDGDVIFCYLMPEPMQRFEAEIWPTLKKGTRVVSHAFRMKDVTPNDTGEGVFLYVKEY